MTWHEHSKRLLVCLFTHQLVSSCCAANFSNNIHTADITAGTLLDGKLGSITEKLFGPARELKFPRRNLKPGVHPRILFSRAEWEELVNCYSENRYKRKTWSKHFLEYTLDKGPNNKMLAFVANLNTSAYNGKPNMSRDALYNLAAEMKNMTEYHEGGIFMYALHSAVNENMIARGIKPYLSANQNVSTVIRIMLNYAKVVLAHYFTYGCKKCTYIKGMKKSDLWDKSRLWIIINDWYTAGLGISLTYDVFYDRLTVDERRIVRSAIALMVKDRRHWGITDYSVRGTPNSEKYPHRIFSNWATYHGNLYLTNAAIEGETDVDEMVLATNASYDKAIERKTIALVKSFFAHSIYPDGSNFEDGYLYNLALREGSLLLFSLARRGHDILNTPRFRNFAYFGAQMMEPYHCGNFIGHSSGGGQLYTTWQGLVRSVYPKGELPAIIWQQRVGLDFKSFNPCRTTWHQTMMQMSILGGEHSKITQATSLQGMSTVLKRSIHMSLYGKRRGLLIARSSISETALYAHFDARPDAFFPGHDNADRGIFTLTALQRSWVTDFDWHFHESKFHSLVHIDGQAQARKAPSVRMLKVKDYPNVVLAAADLTYAYNVQWIRAFGYTSNPHTYETVFINGVPVRKFFVYMDQETVHPRTFGWPRDDEATDIGFKHNTSLWGEHHLGFSGLFNWKRNYRENFVRRNVRSFALVRMHGLTNYLFIGDNIEMADNDTHSFESYLILEKGIRPSNESFCSENFCKLTILAEDQLHLDIYVSGLGQNLSYRFDTIKKHYTRLIVRSVRRKREQFCMVLHPCVGKGQKLELRRKGSRCDVTTGNEIRSFIFSDEDGVAVVPEEKTSHFESTPEPSADQFESPPASHEPFNMAEAFE